MGLDEVKAQCDYDNNDIAKKLIDELQLLDEETGLGGYLELPPDGVNCWRAVPAMALASGVYKDKNYAQKVAASIAEYKYDHMLDVSERGRKEVRSSAGFREIEAGCIVGFFREQRTANTRQKKLKLYHAMFSLGGGLVACVNDTGVFADTEPMWICNSVAVYSLDEAFTIKEHMSVLDFGATRWGDDCGRINNREWPGGFIGERKGSAPAESYDVEYVYYISLVDLENSRVERKNRRGRGGWFPHSERNLRLAAAGLAWDVKKEGGPENRIIEVKNEEGEPKWENVWKEELDSVWTEEWDPESSLLRSYSRFRKVTGVWGKIRSSSQITKVDDAFKKYNPGDNVANVIRKTREILKECDEYLNRKEDSKRSPGLRLFKRDIFHELQELMKSRLKTAEDGKTEREEFNKLMSKIREAWIAMFLCGKIPDMKVDEHQESLKNIGDEWLAYVVENAEQCERDEKPWLELSQKLKDAILTVRFCGKGLKIDVAEHQKNLRAVAEKRAASSVKKVEKEAENQECVAILEGRSIKQATKVILFCDKILNINVSEPRETLQYNIANQCLEAILGALERDLKKILEKTETDPDFYSKIQDAVGFSSYFGRNLNMETAGYDERLQSMGSKWFEYTVAIAEEEAESRDNLRELDKKMKDLVTLAKRCKRKGGLNMEVSLDREVSAKLLEKAPQWIESKVEEAETSKADDKTLKKKMEELADAINICGKTLKMEIGANAGKIEEIVGRWMEAKFKAAEDMEVSRNNFDDSYKKMKVAKNAETFYRNDIDSSFPEYTERLKEIELKMINRDLDTLAAAENDEEAPEIVRNVAREIMGNRGDIKFMEGMPGAAKSGDEGEEYILKHALEQSNGEPERIGSLAHELTHVAVGKTFENSALLFSFEKDVAESDLLELMGLRHDNIKALKKALRKAGLGRSKEGLVDRKLCYAGEDKIQTYVNSFRGQEKITPEEAEKTLDWNRTLGLDNTVIEYDSVINQILLYMHMWEVDRDNPLYRKIREIAEKTYQRRKEMAG